MSTNLARSAFVFAVGLSACAQPPVDPSLASAIASIKAVDNHAHPMRPIPAGAPADTEYDALPLDGIPAFPLPVRLRPDHPVWTAAANALYGVRPDTGAAYLSAIKAAREGKQKELGERFPAWALDQAGIDVMFANRIAVGPGLTPPRFRWVAFDDALMLPLDVKGEATRTPDTRSLYPREATLLRRYMRDLGVASIPTTLDAYVKTVLTATLERQHAGGAVAVKFEAAYLRPLDFDDPDPAAAARIYARYASSGTPTHAEYKTVEDYLFRVIARESGRLGMAVHIHITEGFGGFYASSGSAPRLLEPALNDSTLRHTNFVLVHGGWPLIGETSGLLAKPNVYADISMMTLFIEPSQLAKALRQWIGEWPDKVLFGSDSFEGGPDQGWEEGAWVASSSARRALGLALTAEMREDGMSRERAEEIARMVLRGNAVRVYGLR